MYSSTDRAASGSLPPPQYPDYSGSLGFFSGTIFATMALEIQATETGSIPIPLRVHSEAVVSRSKPKSRDRYPFLDFLRAMASQLIVWHHLAFYGPLAESVYPLAPHVFDWLMRYARMAVQVFFVLGGFFTARSLTRSKP